MNGKHIARIALGASLALALTPSAFAAGTAAGTDVTNTASVDYLVGTVSQPTVNSNTDTFKVDRQILLTVAEVGGAYTDVAPGATAQALKFTVTNNSNQVIDLGLSTTQDATSATDPFGATDDFDVTGVTLYRDDGDGVFNSGTDTVVTYLDEAPVGTSITVFVVANIPSGRADNETAGITLTAQAREGGTASSQGIVVTQTAGADTAGTVDTVWGDTAGDTDASRDGMHSDDDAFRIRTASIAVTKSSSVVSDPFNGGTNPKRIPGAVIEYCIDVNNTGSTAADTVTITDLIPTGTTYVAGSIKTAATGTGTACDIGSGTAEDDNNTGADESDPHGGSYAAGTVSVSVNPSIAGGARSKATFRVTIN